MCKKVMMITITTMTTIIIITITIMITMIITMTMIIMIIVIYIYMYNMITPGMRLSWRYWIDCSLTGRSTLEAGLKYSPSLVTVTGRAQADYIEID